MKRLALALVAASLLLGAATHDAVAGRASAEVRAQRRAEAARNKKAKDERRYGKGVVVERAHWLEPGGGHTKEVMLRRPGTLDESHWERRTTEDATTRNVRTTRWASRDGQIRWSRKSVATDEASGRVEQSVQKLTWRGEPGNAELVRERRSRGRVDLSTR